MIQEEVALIDVWCSLQVAELSSDPPPIVEGEQFGSASRLAS